MRKIEADFCSAEGTVGRMRLREITGGIVDGGVQLNTERHKLRDYVLRGTKAFPPNQTAVTRPPPSPAAANFSKARHLHTPPNTYAKSLGVPPRCTE